MLSDFEQKKNGLELLDKVYPQSILNDLIDGNIQDSEITRTKIAELYEGLHKHLYLAVVDITQYEHMLTHLVYFRDLFAKMQAEYRYFIHLNNIVIIISTDNTILNIERDLKKLNEFFIKSQIYAGISSQFDDLLDVRKYFREAINALNYGLTGKRSQHIFCYDDIRVEHFLNSVKNSADIRAVYSPVIFLIRQYDEENHTSLVNLLYTYLLYGKDIPLTCEKTGITRNELNSQLRMLTEKFEIDWKNGDMLLNIFISLKMLNNQI